MAIATTAREEKIYAPGAWHFVALLAGNAALAFGPLLVRLSDTGPVAAGFWRLLLPLPLFVALAWREGLFARLDRRVALLVLGAGVFFACDLASWHIGIERTKLANATLFGNSGSLILMVWGIVALRRWPRAGEALAMLCAVAGALILMGRSLEISERTFAGDLFCLLAGLFYACYLIPAQRAREALRQWSVLALVCAAGSPILLGTAIAMGEPVWPGPAGFAPLIGLALCSQVIGQGLLVFSLKHFPPLIVGMALLTQPALAALIGWVAFREGLGWPDVAGMALVGGALVLSRVQTRRREGRRAA
ncbi:EamA family transporter [Porphyrobacter algicida]|uniref:EamA family transporter n=1 Tax=Qipengyuania algicida TaxID=1836209 RepID=A0A845AL09_9SPHN|nr:DMT family transporter [Qipengyuania algicida]MXP27718.1 EamA family transporter [Qipengyuania algicida]